VRRYASVHASLPVAVPRWARRTPARLSTRVRRGVVSVPDELLAPAKLDGDRGAWVAVHVSHRRSSHLGTDRGPPGGATRRGGNGAGRSGAGGWSESRWPEHPSDYYRWPAKSRGRQGSSPPCCNGTNDPTRYEMSVPRLGRFDAEIVTHGYGWSHHSTPTSREGFSSHRATCQRSSGWCAHPRSRRRRCPARRPGVPRSERVRVR
jgi:hypothetical protein